MKYRRLKNYKYMLMDDVYTIQTGIKGHQYKGQYLELAPDGLLSIYYGYCWDGATVAIDTPSFMEASMVHDAMYQLMRLGVLDYKVHRIIADKLMYKIARAKKMWWLRAKWVYAGVRTGGEGCARPNSEPEVEIIEVK